MVAIWKSPWCLTFQCSVTKCWSYQLNVFCLGKIVYAYHVFFCICICLCFSLKINKLQKKPFRYLYSSFGSHCIFCHGRYVSGSLSFTNVRTSILSLIWFPLNNLSSSVANYLKFIHNVRDFKRKAKIDLRF